MQLPSDFQHLQSAKARNDIMAAAAALAGWQQLMVSAAAGVMMRWSFDGQVRGSLQPAAVVMSQKIFTVGGNLQDNTLSLVDPQPIINLTRWPVIEVFTSWRYQLPTVD